MSDNLHNSPKKRHQDSKEENSKKQRRSSSPSRNYLNLTTHPCRPGANPVPIKWGAATTQERGPVICAPGSNLRNAIGAHSGSYCIYKAISVALGQLDPNYLPDYTHTLPVTQIGPHPSWFDQDKIVSMDPFGHIVQDVFKSYHDDGVDVKPTIAVTRAHMDVPEITNALKEGRLTADGRILNENGQIIVTKAAIEPVWWIPGVAKRLGIEENALRQHLFEQTNGMYPELVTRWDLDVFLPPIGGQTIYIFGDPDHINNPEKKLTVRVHDECNGSDVFGSDICTCRPYLIHGIEECLKTALEGGVGLIVYFRKEGRALGEVTKYLVYNRRKRQEGGDTAKEYFNCTAMVAGVEDMRFQALMPDSLHWLGITKIDRLISMSNMKYDAIVNSGIEVVERVAIPEELIPADAHVEIGAKVFSGYHAGHFNKSSIPEELEKVCGRSANQ